MRQRLAAGAVILWIVGTAGPAAVQQPTPQVFSGAPAALWIFPPGVAGTEFGVFHFRRSFDLDAQPSRFVVHVSADNRYRLFVNGQQVSSGPQRSDLMHWRYESVDLAPHLRSGRNVLAALVWNWGAERPVAQFSRQTAFLLQGDSPREAAVNSGPEWKVLRSEGYAPVSVSGNAVGGYYASPPGEALDAQHYPWGWEQPGFPDQGWVAASAGTGPRARRTQPQASNPFGEAGGWQLVPRSIPPMEESPTRFAAVRRSEGIEPNDSFLRGTGDLVLPPKTRAVLLLDQSHLTNAFTVLETSGGAGSRVALIYAEALKDGNGNKGNRNQIEGKTIAGVRDVFTLDGGQRRRFQTLWFRTYRYVQVEVETGHEALRIHDLRGIFVGYPFELVARFASDVAWLADMWAINWRGARLCAWETYVDTPYYEQLQYVGDTRIQALITLYMSDDDRLVRQALEHFDLSRIPDGITASRYPSDLGQYIPTFSPIWVAMVHDYWMHREAHEYVRGFLPGIRAVLGWFERRVDETGMLGPISWWPFADWAKGWERGVPPGGTDGHSTVIALQFVYALERAAELEDRLGVPGMADHYKSLGRKVRDAVRSRAWDPNRGLFRDKPDANTYSQQANVMAVLTDAVSPADQARVMERVLSDATLTQSTYYFSYYQLEALRKAGLGDRYIGQLAPWRGMLDLGLTTVPETPEPTRSDSHAWSAHPNYGLLATVLGVRPAEPGFKSVRVQPHLGPLQRAEGRVPHPLGVIEVRLVRTGGDGLRAEVILPTGLEGRLEWGGSDVGLRSGRQELSLRSRTRQSPVR
jgi:hypothetical protein